MNDLGSYPYGAGDSKEAPFNIDTNEEREIDVEVTLTLRKTLSIKVEDYYVKASGKDEDGCYFEDIDYSCCDLVEAVKEQIVLPYDATDYIDAESKSGKRAFRDLKDWEVDDINVERV